ncbi:two-component system phosphate regulon response regulator OmpR [Rhodoligotrophos appendicifer]|uniref:response regulator n=1 Tax=Rhodoligotrophos appendicifer TaxID=987056 RepID=UPI001185C1DB|nr:response regulator [Rhodoligotrophos appendicifer]
MAEPQADPEHVLVVDDDARIRQMLLRYLEGEGYRVSAVADAQAAHDCLARHSIDIILLDLQLPGGDDGLSVARAIRSGSDVPIIMVTGRDDVVDRIVGLEIGADDYVTKPFHLREVLARMKTVMRRRKPAAAPSSESKRSLQFDGWSLDLDRRQLISDEGVDVALTTAEFDLLAIMARHPGRVFTRETLMDLTRGRAFDAFDRVIDAQVARLRKKIEKDPKSPALIKSVRGVGYVFTGKMS